MSNMTFNQYIWATFPVLSSLWRKRYSCVSTVPNRRVLSDAVSRMIEMKMWRDTTECYRLTYAYASLSSYWAVNTLGAAVLQDSSVIKNAQSMIAESSEIFELAEKSITTVLPENPIKQ